MPNGSWAGCGPSRPRPANAETLCAGRFTAADIVIGYALRLADNIGLAKDFGPNVAAYWERLQQRDGFKRAVAAERKAGVEQNVAPRVGRDTVIPGRCDSDLAIPRDVIVRVRCFAPRNDGAIGR